VTSPAPKVAIGLGCSLGDRRMRLEVTLRQLAARPELTLLRASRWYKSPPLAGGTARNWFLNGVAVFRCAAPLPALLALCQDLERRAGRRRARHWGDRPLDLDVVHAQGVILCDPHLTLPHPAVARRPFVLLPLLEVWPDAADPTTDRPWAASPPPKGPRPWAVGVVAATCPPLYLDPPPRRGSSE
jgi:2-amino-4-hydroxy-6-hydroxymethyldihydropteridine diphosphokinase